MSTHDDGSEMRDADDARPIEEIRAELESRGIDTKRVIDRVMEAVRNHAAAAPIDHAARKRCSCSFPHPPHDWCDGNPKGEAWTDDSDATHPATDGGSPPPWIAGETTTGGRVSIYTADADFVCTAEPHRAAMIVTAINAHAGLLAERDTLRERLSMTEFHASALAGTCREMTHGLAAMRAERDKLQAFKSWVHTYLDSHDVPHHPPGTHGAAGCRIGDRMDWLMAELADARTLTAARQAEIIALTNDVAARVFDAIPEREVLVAERDALRAERDRLKAACEAALQAIDSGYREELPGQTEGAYQQLLANTPLYATLRAALAASANVGGA